MHPMIVPLLAVVAIHYIYRAYETYSKRRERRLRERVTYMLWTAAQI